jgi:hypothetical protein
MTGTIAILLLTFSQFAAGFGLLSLLGIWLRAWLFIPLAIILGIGIISFLPFILELLHIPLTALNIYVSIAVAVVLLNLKLRRGIVRLKEMLRHWGFATYIYEIPFLLVIGFIVFVSVWRCFYFPPTPRDLTSGPEVIAEYAVKEKTMINSVFTVDLSTTNNQFKPTYITSLQIIYKYAGFPFGQVWLSTLFICFLVFLYHILIARIHRLLAGFLMLCFLAIPEMYAYSFMALFDYSNAIFFTLGAWFLFDYFDEGRYNSLALSGVLLALATYTRSETLVLTGMLSLALVWHHIRNWNSLTEILKSVGLVVLPAVLVYLLTVTVYIHYYLPGDYTISSLINPELFNPLVFFNRFIDYHTRLLIGDSSVTYYGYFIYLFFVLLVFDLVMTDRWKPEPRNLFYGVLVVYLGLPIVGHILPLMDIDHSTKRGLFKIFPLMLLYMGSSGLLRNFSEKITAWQQK